MSHVMDLLIHALGYRHKQFLALYSIYIIRLHPGQLLGVAPPCSTSAPFLPKGSSNQSMLAKQLHSYWCFWQDTVKED